MSNPVKILSMNCQGLASPHKRRDVFHYLKQKSYSIYLLQDTHFDPKSENCIRAEWGYKCYFASYRSNARGVAILFNNNFEFQVVKIFKDIAGNYLFILLMSYMMSKHFLIVNIYGPNSDNPNFYSELEKHVKEIDFDYLIMGGDWNIALNFILDCCQYKHLNNPKAQEQVLDELIPNLDLLDVWRENNPELRRYTWRRKKPFQQSRIDFFLISDLLSSYVTDVDIKSGYRTDHSAITLTLSSGQDIKHHTLWKFNNSLLKEKQFVDEINEVIKSVKEEYAALPYNRTNISQVPNDTIQFTISDQLFLDVLLMKIRSKTISYATMRKRENEQREKELEQNIQELEARTDLTENEQIKLELDK